MTTSEQLTFGSLFAGIGGIDLGFERAGMRCLWQCEFDAYCRRVLAKNFPGVRCYPDVRELTDPPPVDVLVGGFPCQPFSLAGKRKAADDPRHLWPEFARLVGELRPRYVVGENVRGLASKGLDAVLGDLAGLGYDAEWQVVSAASVGAPHLRERVFIVAYLPDPERKQLRVESGRSGREDRPGTPLACIHGETWVVADPDSEGRQGSEPKQARGRGGSSDCRAHVADANGAAGNGEGCASETLRGPETVERPGRRSCVLPHPDGSPVLAWGEWWRAAQAGCSGQWAAEPDVGRVAHGVPHRLDRLRGLGNAVVPQVAEFVGRLIVEHAHVD